MNTLVLLLFIPGLIRRILLHTYWWQIKEYRLDRMSVFWKVDEAKFIFFPILFWLKIVVLELSFLRPSVILVIPLLFVVDLLLAVWETLRHTLKRPVFTLRAQELLLTGVIAGGLGIWASFWPFAEYGIWRNLLIVDLLSWFVVPAGILWTTPLVERKKEMLVQAVKHRLSNIHPIVVGITGSFGKTSTKEFVATVLSQKYQVAKNDKSENTEFGLAQNVLKHVEKGTEVFVAEMGAYKKGEIKKLCNMVRPNIGILTAIGNQHLALFGSQENIIQAKYELIDSLPDDGIAIFNGDNDECLKLALQEHRKTIIYTTHTSEIPKRKKLTIVQADNLVVLNDSIKFTVHINNKQFTANVRILGAHFVQNILGAVAIGYALEMNFNQLKIGVESIRPVGRTMEPKSGLNESLIIDDSYSANFHGFKAAIEWLKNAKAQRKFIITPGIIELGEECQRVHEILGQEMKFVADKIFVTSKEPITAFKNGLQEQEYKLSFASKNEVEGLKRELQKGDILLIEGKIPDYLRKRFV